MFNIKECLACGKAWEPIKTIMALDCTFKDTRHPIDFCSCGLGVTRLNSTSKEVLEANSRMYDNIEERIYIYFNRLNKHFIKRYSDSLKTISKYKSVGAKLLEVGANIGVTTNLAAKFGYDVQACEFNDRCRAFSELVFNLKTSKDLFNLNSKFDIITMCDVLEHFTEPDLALKKAHSLLNDNGIVFIQLPNCSSDIAKKLGDDWSWYNPPDHTFHFNLNSLSLVLEKYGFVVIWHRTVDIVEDLDLMRFISNIFKSKLVKILYYFFYIGFITNKKGRGGLIQLIARKK